MKLQKYISKLLDVLIGFILLLFFASFGFRDGRTSGWYQQFLPNLNGKQIADITFLDSLTGYAVATQQFDTSYVLKTTNGGDNWEIIYRSFLAMEKIQFLSINTGYTCGAYLFKTTNGGFNWNQVTAPAISPENMYVLDENNIWIISSESFVGGVFFTSNGGLSWTQQFSAGTENPNKIYMYNARIGFICNNTNNSSMKKTTNGGQSWFPVLTSGSFRDLLFVDSLTGWRAMDFINKTTNGGLNWFDQSIPRPNEINGGIRKLISINKDTIWGSYASYTFPNIQTRGVLYRTTNGGNNWLYQIPDTSFGITRYQFIQFINKYTGWAYTGAIHTTNGGDTTFLSAVHQINSEIPKDYILFQNYPNPFNAKSNIKYQISKISDIQIKIFDIQGKEISILVNKKQTPGTYEYNFDANDLTSGVYFYTLFANGKMIDTKKAILLK